MLTIDKHTTTRHDTNDNSGGQPDRSGPGTARSTVRTLAAAGTVGLGLILALGLWLSPGEARESTTIRTAPSAILTDPGPSWEPGSNATAATIVAEKPEVVDPATEFGGTAAPGWHPNHGRLETYLGGDPASGPR